LAQAQQAAQQQNSGMDALAQAAIEEAKASMADVQRKAADDVSKAMLAKEKQEVETARLLAAAEADRQKIQIQAAQDMAKFQAEQQKAQADNDFRVQQLEVELAKARIAQETVIAKTAMELDQKTQAAALSLAAQQPALANYLTLLNNKIDLIARHTVFSDYQHLPKTRISLSEDGIAFKSPRMLYKGSYVLLRIIFLPRFAPVVTFAQIIRCESRDNSYNVAAKFFKLDANLQQLIAKTLTKAQQNSQTPNTP
jgi:hypothetical protein